MTFEEKYAAQGRKLDELKAKLDAAIDARKLAHEQKCEELEAALDEFDAALNAQIDKQYDTIDTQIGKQFDTMERRAEMLDAQIEKQCDTIDAQIDKQCDTIDAQVEKQLDTMAERVDKLDAKLEEQAAKAKAAFTLDKATAEAVANEPTRINEIQKQTAGDFAAAEENARLIRERRDAKCSNIKLRTEMTGGAVFPNLYEQRIPVTVGRNRNDMLIIPACFAFEPEFLPGSAPEAGQSFFQRNLQTLPVHISKC